MRTLLTTLLCLALLASPLVGYAQESSFTFDEDNDRWLSNAAIEPGRGRTLALATMMGTVTGLIFSGLVLTFYWNPEADVNFDTVFIVTTICGTAGGVVLGMTLPVSTSKLDAAASIKFDKIPEWNMQAPRVSVISETLPQGINRIWHTNLLGFSF